MGRASNRRKLATAAIGVVAVAAVLAFVGVLLAPRSGGPLPTTPGWEYTFEVAAGGTASWSIPLPGSEAAPVRLTDIKFNGLHGAEILGAGICRTLPPSEPGGDIVRCAPITARSWPPPNVEVIELGGEEIRPGLDPLLDLVIGFRRTDTREPSGWTSITLIYEIADGTFQVTEPWSITLVNRGELPRG